MACGYEDHYHIGSETLPTWINDIAMEQKNNFYEIRVANYRESSIRNALDWQGRISGKSETMIAKAFEDCMSIDF